VAVDELERLGAIHLATRVQVTDRRIPRVPSVEAALGERDRVRVQEADARAHLVEVVDPRVVVGDVDHGLRVGDDTALDLDAAVAHDVAVGTITGQHDRERWRSDHVPDRRVATAFAQATWQLFAMEVVEVDRRVPRDAVHA
jgi:hypothetical protein